MDRQSILKSVRIGSHVAEDEAQSLANYFVETDTWQRLWNGEVDIIYGAKGSGKSALYLLLLGRKDQMEIEKGVWLIAGEEISGDPVFQDVAGESKRSEREFEGLWRIFFLSLIGNELAKRLEWKGPLKEILERLQAEGLIPTDGLKKALRATKEYVAKVLKRVSIEASTSFDNKGVQTAALKISLQEPSSDEERAGTVSAQALLERLDDVLQKMNLRLWILLDRLDVAFAESEETERIALRSLFRVYGSLNKLRNISLKIFLRSDIWERITRYEGFREATHITRTVTISWNESSLLHLLMSRLLVNPPIEELLKFKKGDILARAEMQRIAFYLLFPDKVERGEKKRDTFPWILSRIQDGKQQPAPRELIHLIGSAQESQIRMEETGTADKQGKWLFEPAALKEGLKRVSEYRLSRTLFAEYPKLRPYIEAFSKEKTEHITETICRLFARHGLESDKPEAVIRSLVEVGFLEERTQEPRRTYWVPFLYRDALGMIQGAAFDRAEGVALSGEEE